MIEYEIKTMEFLEIERTNSLHFEKIKRKIGYHICTGIKIPISSKVVLETVFQYLWLSPSVERGYMSLGSSHGPPPYDLEDKGHINLNSVNLVISFMYKF